MHNKNHKKAFSLLELLVVILILGLLAAFVAPRVIAQGERAQRDLVCTQMKTIGEALKTFKLDNGMFPDTEEGLAALVTNPDSDKYPNYLNNGYIERIPKDSWKTPITYIKNDDTYELISFGADRKEGGSGDGEDIFLSKCLK
ncbi:MAG: type II secretion system major pseudopilin GspG [Campylobacterales bacterium]|nr:type II secretion system major pseudopilin GspG [Campylobacterales bacterium]